jgi:uncharacterized protein (DUF1800 family)
MKPIIKIAFTVIVIFFGITSSSFIGEPSTNPTFTFPYKKAGLTEREAAAHLLNRFTFGATPAQVDAVVKTGLENWFLEQLNAKAPNDTLNRFLKNFDALNLTNAEVVKLYPKIGQVRKLALKQGIIDKDSAGTADKKGYRQQVLAYMKENGLRPQQELFRQLIGQKIVRAAYSNNQLQELLTDFWFNHFNVSLTKGQSAEFIPAYERDVIRPNVLGKFEDLLLATAKSPAMLTYLDNFTSAGTIEDVNVPGTAQQRKRLAARMGQQMNDTAKTFLNKLKQNKKNQGLNENYAREVMELHTLGVDGGYTQQDVTQAARVLTGWTVNPMITQYGAGAGMKNVIKRIGEDKLEKRGFVQEGDFLFAINRHDRNEKTVLGKKFPANGGYEEGVELLKMLAHHPSTSRFITRKLAIRFVSDNPAQTLLDKMAKTFTEKDGDIRQVLITMASSPEFWSKETMRSKTKSPFELVISAVRAVNAEVRQPYQLFNWMEKMGQKIYFYQAPTGFPDRSEYWINTGALLNRMNFGLAFASHRIPGVRINVSGLNKNREPESAEAALVTYAKLILPERNLDETIKRLTPMLNDPELVKKIDEAANKATVQTQTGGGMNEDAMINNDMDDVPARAGIGKKGGKGNRFASMQTPNGNNSMLAQVVGIILGSPEFQRK